MAWGKKADAYNAYKMMFRTSTLDAVRSLYEPYQSFWSVFISNPTILLVLIETIAGVPHRQVTKWAKSSTFYLSFSQARTIMVEVITNMIRWLFLLGYCTHSIAWMPAIYTTLNFMTNVEHCNGPLVDL